MAGITLEAAKKHLDVWLEAEMTVATGQSYTIGSRTLTRANLTEIRNAIEAGEHTAQGRKKQDKAGSNTGLVKFVEIWRRYGTIIMLPPLYW